MALQDFDGDYLNVAYLDGFYVFIVLERSLFWWREIYICVLLPLLNVNLILIG